MNLSFSKTTKCLFFFFFISQVLIWLAFHSWWVEKSFSLGEKKELASSLERENEQLEREVASASSLKEIKKRAEELGLSSKAKIAVIDWKQPMAFQANHQEK